jgi:A/G-specific adenine glycosylase
MKALAQMTASEMVKLRRALLGWYDGNRRDLPWRSSRDPYRIWVSEVMLQQTRVAAVLLYYERFLKRFPTVRELAGARPSSVLAQWSGLGYYRRARNLHAAAKRIVQHRGGEFPQTAEQWRELPGVGRYTAAAISSIAFQEPVAVVDGNIERVLKRVSGRSLANAGCWKVAEALVDPIRPGDFNQALMELGATVCLPFEPHCSHCPIRRFCRTRGNGPSPNQKPPQRKREIAYALRRQSDSIRLVRRKVNATLMPAMWELPETEPARGERLFSVKHSITRTDFKVHVIDDRDHGGGTWIPISRIAKLPLTGLSRKILRRAGVIQ